MFWRIIKLENETILESILGFLFYALPIVLTMLLIVEPKIISGVAAKIPPINSIMCSSLKNKIDANDKIGRELWNAYQVEVSALASIDTRSLVNQQSNVARRAQALLLNDGASWGLIQKKKYCVSDAEDFTTRGTTIVTLLGDLKVRLSTVGYTGPWNRNFYSVYNPYSQFLK